MATPANLTIENASASKAGLVSSVGIQRSWRSYGTVKDSSPRLHSKANSFLVHSVQEGDTLQGLALKYDVTVHQIQRLNNLWGSESILSRTELKIPFVSRSLTSSPVMSRAADRHSNLRKDQDRKTSSLEEVRVSDDAEEVVRKKPLGRRAGSANPSSGGGERTIASILDSADQQLRISREFAEKLARRSAALKLPADAYNRGRSPQKEEASSSSQESSLEMDLDSRQLPSSSSKRRQKAAENVSQTREQVENDIFEL